MTIKVLVTGAAGKIGKSFRERYADYYSLRAMYHNTRVEPFPGEEAVQGDITDFDSVLRATKGVDAVVHLALVRRRDWGDWDSAHRNMVGTYHVFEAARRFGLKKVVFASSNHACGYAVKENDLVGPDAPLRPDSFYGANKAFGETLGRYYSDKHSLSAICLRIGWLPGLEDPSDRFREILSQDQTRSFYSAEKLIAMWISNRDMAQLIHKSLETDVKYGIFYGVSENTPRIFDLTTTKEKLGYEPEDHVEDYLP